MTNARLYKMIFSMLIFRCGQFFDTNDCLVEFTKEREVIVYSPDLENYTTYGLQEYFYHLVSLDTDW